jgi:5-(carboxyamino)imidazole ribonucleotide mutase
MIGQQDLCTEIKDTGHGGSGLPDFPIANTMRTTPIAAQLQPDMTEPSPSIAARAAPNERASMSEISEEPQPIQSPIPSAVEEVFEEADAETPLVGIIMGSKSDMEKMKLAAAALDDVGIASEVRVMSAHRDPEMVRDYCLNARMRGLKVIIAGAGMSAALPGVAAAHTDLPVIGVPILGKSLGGLDALLSAVQMPPGIPVACVAIDGAKNAGILAARIINA